MTIKIACLQLDIAFGNPNENERRVEREIEKISKNHPDIIVLPELWTTGYDLTRLDEIADEGGMRTKAFIQKLAKSHHVNIVAGSIARKTDRGVTNTMYIADRNGIIVGEYSKLHLFQLMDEHLYLQPGEEMGLFTLENTRCAGVICYDIRFPEWIRVHMVQGAEVLFVVAEWPLPRLSHWRTLLAARAIENQCYVIACNRAGSDPNNVFAGHSLVVDPWGEIIAEANEEPCTLMAQIDLQKVREVRKQIPIFADRRANDYIAAEKNFLKKS
ncbi:carbon-nitrogen family hydrolase [Parageobacillus toebii NBRC 107807]|uniref:Amidohydrolase n=2 Tax=Anoxybacillaceae TaxID=3120669 RepID=A0A6G9J3Z3_9BACL|nr:MULTISPECIES: carbon-nitrogen family hydrolase [Bacillaceae]OQP00293.1 carbon-nitrogen hydrolase [Geobacillus sp. 44C]PDM40126.1 carbon-nitrogen family hydrolase [Parageobacillus yumthangensis]TXK89626.1 carbon-nitrogen family hydrolase [Parageobacillus sp. SY1]MBB3868145.1 putative amidohydrolase [Parageobacillus toebii NBRC 107807]MED4970539.1 carbon-nitrogen family hydrolase [Parageobacillus toebii]